MFDRLDEIEKRFAEIEAQLYDTAVLQDRARYEKLVMERKEIARIVAVYAAYKKARAERDENRLLLGDADREIRDAAREEIDRLDALAPKLEEELKTLLLPADPLDGKDIVLEVRAGTGGEEASLFADELMRMYMKFADAMGWRVELMGLSQSASGGVKEAILEIGGENVYSWLKYESGVHRVQRVPVTETQGRIHTSAATVAILPEADEVDITIRDEDIHMEFMRASGAGGQHVNKTDSAVRLVHLPTGITIHCQDERSQHKNKSKALKILRARLMDMQRTQQASQTARDRRSQVGSGDRSEKVRTYNFPQNRVTDHRIGVNVHNLPDFLNGNIKPLVEQLRIHFQTQQLNASTTT